MEQEDFNIREHQLTSKERDFENALRPLSFEDFSGQDKVVENLRIFVKAARLRGEALDHVLLHGPPGLGKTTLSNIIANELGVGFKVTSGPVLDKPGDLAGVLTSLEPNDVLFIDEIHRLSPVVEEYLYSAMEDYRIDIMIDKGPSARSIQIDLNPFTLVGATTRSGLLTAPLRARFGINLHLEYYDDDILSNIIRRSASILDVPCSVRAASEIASRSRGTPRIANALLRRVRDFAQVKGSGSIDTEIAQFALEALNIDKYGLDEIDNKILCTIIDKFKGGPVGITTIATALGEDAGTIEEVYEPFLIKEGFMKRTPRGREVTELAYKHLGRSLYCIRNPPAQCAGCPAPAGRAARRPAPAGQFPAGCGRSVKRSARHRSDAPFCPRGQTAGCPVRLPAVQFGRTPPTASSPAAAQCGKSCAARRCAERC